MIIPNSVIVPHQQLVCPETPYVWKKGMLIQKKQNQHNCLLQNVEIF